jgi:hypothetical protein
MLARRSTTRRIGPWGTGVRVAVAAAMLAAAAVIGIGAVDAALGLFVFPLAVAAVVTLRGRDAPAVHLMGPAGHCINCAMIAAAFIVVPVAALLFYSTSMLVAAIRGYGGCELFAVSNWLRGRDDEIACPVFHPVDVAESRAARRKVSA